MAASAHGTLVVTGASRGIGAATARLAGTRGYAVCVNFRERADRAEEVVASIRAAGGQALGVAADVADEADVARLFAAADGLGPLTGLVNNAATAGVQSRVDGLDLAMLRRVLHVNVVGAFLCAREAIRRMSTRNGGAGGAIVNMSSQTARFGGTLRSPYAASKRALESFTVGLAREAAADGIRVNAVSPGLIATDIHEGIDEARLAAQAASVPLGRFGTPEEVAEAILWLLSDEAAHVTGAVLPVAAGR